MLPCRLEHTSSSWRLGEGVGGEPRDGLRTPMVFSTLSPLTV